MIIELEKLKKLNYIVIALILLLPVLVKLPYLISGTRIDAVAVSTKRVETEDGYDSYTELEYQVGEYIYTMETSTGITYNTGEKVKVIYAKNDPYKSILASPLYIYYDSIFFFIALGLLILWSSAYSSIKEHEKERLKKAKRKAKKAAKAQKTQMRRRDPRARGRRRAS